MVRRFLTLIWWNHSRGDRVILVLLRVRADHVIVEPAGSPRKVGQRIIIDQSLADLVDAGTRNFVVGERLPDVLAVSEGVARGVVDEDWCAAGVDQARKVSCALRRRRVRRGIGQRAGVADPLHVEHEEGLVLAVIDLRNAHRPIHYESRLVPAHHAARVLGRVAGKTVGVQLVVAEKLVQGSVQRVGSALQDGVDHRAAAVAVLRVIRVRLDRHFLNGVGRRDKAHVDGRRGMPFSMIWY